jgi:hypothetical protein
MLFNISVEAKEGNKKSPPVFVGKSSGEEILFALGYPGMDYLKRTYALSL